MRHVFLDANVLFSAAWRADAGLAKLWRTPGVVLLTSHYALAEALVNLESDDQRRRLDDLMQAVTLTPDAADPTPPTDAAVNLPEKDRPILDAAIRARADYLLTGDLRHFGPYMGRTVHGVTILRPADFLRQRKPR